jgi:hypothetical protein
VTVHAPVSRWFVADLKVLAGQFTHVDKAVEPPSTYFFPAGHEGCDVQEGLLLPEEYLPASDINLTKCTILWLQLFPI